MIRALNMFMRRVFAILLLSLCFTQELMAEVGSFLALLSLDEAARRIIQQGNNKVLSTKTEKIQGKQVHVIKVLTPEGRIQHIKIEAETGRVVK